jgi:hypothetical protein
MARGGEKVNKALTPLDEVQVILERANTEDPDPADVLALQRVLEERPDMWHVCGGGLAHQAVVHLLDNVSATGLVREFAKREVETIRCSLGYAHAPEIERLLIEQVALCWLRLNLLEQRYTGFRSEPMGIDQAAFLERRLSAVQRRFLRAVETLARVRKVTRQTVALQVNIAAEGGQQMNVLGDIKRAGGADYTPPQSQ